MISSIQAGNTGFYNNTQNAMMAGKISTYATGQQAAVQNKDENATASSQGDMLTISEEGAQAAKTFVAQSANRPSVNGLSEETYVDSRAQALSSAASSMGITQYTAMQNQNSANSAAVSGSSTSSSSSSSETNLSGYSESELRKMVQNGEITQAQYAAELKSREQGDTTSDEQGDTVSDRPNDMPPSGGPNGMPSGGPNDMPAGGPNGMPSGGPDGMPAGGPNGMPSGGPDNMPFGGANGMPAGGPNGMPFGGPDDMSFNDPNNMPFNR